MPVIFRSATAADADDAVPLIYSSGPAAFDYVFTVPGRATAGSFLRMAFLDGRGEFGFRNHVVGVLDGVVVAAGAAWSGESSPAFTMAAVRQILRRYGPLAGGGVMVRGIRIESIVEPPGRGCWYLAHLGVHPAARGRGIGAGLVHHLLASGRRRGFRIAALDVSATNPRAQALYQRLGFVVRRERASRLGNGRATVPDHRRMELRLAPST